MSSDSDNAFYEGMFNLLVVAGAIALVCFIVYWVFSFVFSFLPFVVFYIAPFVGGAFAFGFFFDFCAKAFTDRSVDFRALSIAIPLCALILYAFVGAPKKEYKYTVVQETKAKVSKTEKIDKPPAVEEIIQWPWLYEAYWKFDSVVEKRWPWQGLFYDQRHLAVALWLSLFIGGPTVFWYFFAKKSQEEEDKRIKAILSCSYKLQLKEKDEKIDELANKNRSLSHDLSEQREEIVRLRKRDEYLTKKEKEKAGTHKGVLDSDDF
ncbi:MAG: hypothetical protein HY537_07740 [Deltaproteobacteria bacterium]|nr:hypothetical protein [Deltaproteobacteria bacterium]